MTPAEALRRAAALGPYFAWEPWDGRGGWRPLSELLDAEVVAERVAVARQTLVRMSGLSDRADPTARRAADRGRRGDDPAGRIGEREVASITFLGWASRLVSPVLGAVATTGVLPRARVGQLWWRPVEGGPLPVAYSGATAGEFDLEVVGTLLRVVSKRYSLPEHLLWGNVASALGGAAGMIADAAPAHAERAAAVVEELLGREPLRGTAKLHRPDAEISRWFLVRRNCCLYYRIPGGGTCGDCVLTPEEVRRQQ